MLARIWRFFVAASDWRTIWRKLNGRTFVDVVFVTNMRDEVDRRRYLGKWHPPEGYFNGPRYWLGNIAGRTRALDITTDEMGKVSGRRKAREQFYAATQWAVDNGAKVVLLAATTKRLFEGPELAELKAKFPDMIFTIGDNGTVLLLIKETLRALEAAGLKPGHSRIAVLGPYGFLGDITTCTLKNLGYEIVGAGPNPGGLERVVEAYGIPVCQTLAEIGKVDAVVACTHSEKISLTTESVELLRHDNKKLLVIDVAEPSNLRYREYQKCKDVVIRQDAGNAYAPGLKYVLGAISYRMFRLTRGVTFGCFAEALSLAAALKRGERIPREVDWLTVNEGEMELVKEMFEKDGFRIPSPRCFGQPVKSFDLNLAEVGKRTTRTPVWKLAAQKLHLL